MGVFICANMCANMCANIEINECKYVQKYVKIRRYILQKYAKTVQNAGVAVVSVQKKNAPPRCKKCARFYVKKGRKEKRRRPLACNVRRPFLFSSGIELGEKNRPYRRVREQKNRAALKNKGWGVVEKGVPA